MKDLNEFIDRYVATWNEPDEATRAARVRELWSERACLFNRSFEYVGRDRIEAAVTRSYGLFVSKGFTFRQRGETMVHHRGIRFPWEMITADGAVDSRGTQFLVLDADGLILLDYQFTDPGPGSEDLRRERHGTAVGGGRGPD